MKTRNTILRACAIGTLTFGLALLALWGTGNFPPVALANSGGSVTYRTLTKCTPTGGTITNNPTGTTFVNNTVVALTANPSVGYTFTGWTGAITGTTNPVNLTMNANKSVCATFKPTLSIMGSPGMVSEGGNASFWVRLSAASVDTVTVAYSVSGGTATGGGVDYTAVSGTLTFAPGITYQFFTVPTVLDTIDDEYENIEYLLSSPVNAILQSSPTSSVMIGDPPSPGVSFASGSTTIVESAGSAVLSLDMLEYLGGSIGVSYRYSGTATPEADYSATVTSISIQSMQEAGGAAIEIPIVDDELDEGDETVIVTLRQPPWGYLMEPVTHTLTIQDDDDEPLVASFTATPESGAAPL